jgi:flagellar basal-body rod modification protein FlgD
MIVSDVTYHEQETQTAERRDEIGKEAFLTLLLAQLSHQDPLNPMDSLEFTSQLSQFSQLEQMVGLNEKLDDLLLYQSSLNNWQGVAMIDREIDAQGDWLTLDEGTAGLIGYTLDEGYSQVTVKIFDGSGKLVRTLDHGARERGEHLIEWDGKDDLGKELADGRYLVTVTGGTEETTATIPTFVRGIVTGVSFESTIPLLLVGGEEIPFASVLEIRGMTEG